MTRELKPNRVEVCCPIENEIITPGLDADNHGQETRPETRQ